MLDDVKSLYIQQLNGNLAIGGDVNYVAPCETDNETDRSYATVSIHLL